MKVDYEKLGLKVGIEIHQQLDTKKLFCLCLSEIRDEPPDIKVERKLRAVSGELGNFDPAALHEFLMDRKIVYEAYSDSNCLVELDEEPPHFLNNHALDIVIEISLLLNALLISELQIMRKIVIDGSNPSGFQRTVLVAIDGYIETSKGKVKIPSICLEEDAGRKIEEKKGVVTYRLDRLGIPLVEISTCPDIKSPEHTREVAEKLGMILRATGKVKRGLGTIRQDLNISISEGERVEMKGVQDLRSLSKVVEFEVKRQLMLIDVRKELKKRKAGKNDLKKNFVDVTKTFKNTDARLVKNMISFGAKVIGVKLPFFSGLLKGKLGPELADYAKSVGVKGIFHSDELPAYGIIKNEVKQVKEKLNLMEKDAFALVVEEEPIAKKALEEVLKRCEIAFTGVPKETRKANIDGTSSFIRPLPGAGRMYPETDEPTIELRKDRIRAIKNNLSKLPEELKEYLINRGLSEELSNQLIHAKEKELFMKFIKKFKRLNPAIIATTLISTPKEVKKRFKIDTGNLKDKNYDDIFRLLTEDKIAKESIPDLVVEILNSPRKGIEDIINEKGLSILSEDELTKIVKEILKENSGIINKLGKEKGRGIIIGKVMAKCKGRCSAKKLIEIIEKEE